MARFRHHSEADRSALVRLFDEHANDVYRYCLTRSGDTQVADDATSEAFLAAARQFSEGQGELVDRPWLFVVARRRMIDHWRGEQRHRRRVERARELVETANDGDQLAGVELSERAMAAIESLPSRQRFALALRYLDGYSVNEVADLLDVSYAAAESLLARARNGFVRAWNLVIEEQSAGRIPTSGVQL